jgi:hypothetical protein
MAAHSYCWQDKPKIQNSKVEMLASEKLKSIRAVQREKICCPPFIRLKSRPQICIFRVPHCRAARVVATSPPFSWRQAAALGRFADYFCKTIPPLIRRPAKPGCRRLCVCTKA